MDNFDLKKYLAEGWLFKDKDEFKQNEPPYTEENPMLVKPIGRKRGVRLNLKKVAKILKDAGYQVEKNKKDFLTIDYIETYSKNPNEQDYGTLRFFKNGEVFGEDNWGEEINSEDEVIPTVEKFLKDQEELYNR